MERKTEEKTQAIIRLDNRFFIQRTVLTLHEQLAAISRSVSRSIVFNSITTPNPYLLIWPTIDHIDVIAR